jgi:CelD/BcsL family acetyltransferase involved in cellulose biosynthesis
MLLRPTDELPFAGVHRGMWDAGSTEYTGPLARGVSQRFALKFKNRCDAVFRSERIITEFAHLNPWADNSHLLEANCLYYNREIVWVDVSLTPDVLWSEHFAHACQKNISRARREGVRLLCATADDEIKEFYRIYIHTMQRNHAQPCYYFTYEYFKSIRDELADHSRFVLAEYKGQIIAATLYLHDDTEVFSYLGGSDESFQNVRPTNAVIYDTICWAHDAGKKRLILGGGYKPDDGIYHFKATFSRYRQSFYTYRRVHLEDSYVALDKSWRAHYGICGDNGAFFPSYRCIPEHSPRK